MHRLTVSSAAAALAFTAAMSFGTGPVAAQEQDSYGSIVRVESHAIIVRTSDDELARYELADYSNKDGDKIAPNESYIFVVDRHSDGQWYLVSLGQHDSLKGGQEANNDSGVEDDAG